MRCAALAAKSRRRSGACRIFGHRDVAAEPAPL